MSEDPLQVIALQAEEHEAWQAVVAELRAADVGDIERGGRHERLHDAIVRWGEELAQLRMADPNLDHAEHALEMRRDKYLAWAKEASS